MNLPSSFKEYAIEALGAEVAATLFEEISKGSDCTSVRVNPLKTNSFESNSQSIELMLADGVDSTPVPWSKLGFYLSQRPVFTLDPLFHSGAYYVQEAGSMYMELAANAIEADFKNRVSEGEFFSRELNVLDLCAAPGGKSTHLHSLIGKNSVLVANEVIKSRATILADNVAKWGADNIVVTNNDPADFSGFENWFDLIVVDAPCSGEGLFRKDHQAIEEWSPANVNLCAQRQQRILADIWPALKPGGFLIYSTCTYNKYENDGNLAYMRESFGAEVVSLNIPPDSGIIATAGGGAQFVPGQVMSEGQFFAVMHKDGPTDEVECRGNKKGSKGAKKGQKEQFEKDCRLLGENYIKTLHGDLVKGYRDSLYERIKFVEGRLRVVLSGVAIATKKGKDYIPHADLALLHNFTQKPLPEGITAIEVSKEDALKFLAKEPLVFADAPNGYLLLTYKGLGLGFVKNLGNRSNNLHPMARRIRMDIR